jgi:hypothetical protein
VLFEGKASVVGSEALRLAAVLVLTYCLSPLEVRQWSTAIGGKDGASLPARPRRLLKKL